MITVHTHIWNRWKLTRSLPWSRNRSKRKSARGLAAFGMGAGAGGAAAAPAWTAAEIPDAFEESMAAEPRAVPAPMPSRARTDGLIIGVAPQIIHRIM